MEITLRSVGTVALQQSIERHICLANDELAASNNANFVSIDFVLCAVPGMKSGINKIGKAWKLQSHIAKSAASSLVTKKEGT